MHVAVILPRNFFFEVGRPNSIETVVRTFARHSRHRTTVFCDEGAGDHGPVETITVKPGTRRVRNDRVIEKLKLLKPDLVEAHQHILTATRIAKALPTVPSVLYRHNSYKVPKHWLQALVYLQRYKRFGGTVFVSEFTRQEFLHRFPKMADTTHAILNSIEAGPWLAEPGPREKLIAYGGRAAPEKGFAELCAAVPTLLDANPEWRFEMCALDWERREPWSQSLIDPLLAYGDRFAVQKDQPLESVQALLKRSAITLMPSIFEEPFGLAALEAHAAGSALVSSGSGGLREASGDHAVYLDAVTPEAIVAATQELIDDEKRRLEMTRAAQEWVLAEHDPGKRADELDTLREAIANGTERQRGAPISTS